MTAVASYTLFGQPAAPASLSTDATGYTMGVQFSVSRAALLTAVWFYSAPGAAVLPSEIVLYAVTGEALVHQEAASWSGAAGSGWVRAAFASPPSLTAGTAYKAAVIQASAAEWYANTANYWSTGPGSAGITSGPLSAPDNAAAAQGQDTFFTGSGYPNSAFSATNYWMDPEITLPVSGQALVPALSAAGVL